MFIKLTTWCQDENFRGPIYFNSDDIYEVIRRPGKLYTVLRIRPEPDNERYIIETPEQIMELINAERK